MKIRITNNDIFIFIRDLFTSNWPAGEVFPKSLEDSLVRLYEPIHLMEKILRKSGQLYFCPEHLTREEF